MTLPVTHTSPEWSLFHRLLINLPLPTPTPSFPHWVYLVPLSNPPSLIYFLFLFFVVAKLDSQAVSGTAEGSWLNFPVRYRVGKKADSMV